MEKFNLLELEHVEIEFPIAKYDIYEKEYTLPFLYHYYRANSYVRKYIQNR